jgi:hypothetical protein
LAVLALVVGSGLAGCKSQQAKALEEAKKQAAATGQPQQVVSVDKDGTTTTTVVQPPAQGQAQPAMTTTTAPAMAGQPKPAPMEPKVTPVANQTQEPAQQLADELDQKPQPGQPQSGQPQASQPQGQQSQQQAPPSVTIPAGTSLAIRVDQTIAVKTARAGDRFTGEVVDPVSDGYGSLIVPKGTRVRGVVDASHKRGHFKGASVLELRLTSMQLGGQELPIETREFAESKKGKGKRTAAFIGGGSGLGMLIGGVATGGAGLLWGGLAGAGAGTAAAGLTGNRDLVIPAETVVHFKLAQDIVVQQGQ